MFTQALNEAMYVTPEEYLNFSENEQRAATSFIEDTVYVAAVKKRTFGKANHVWSYTVLALSSDKDLVDRLSRQRKKK